MNKKIIGFLVVGIVTISMLGCGAGGNSTSTPTITATADNCNPITTSNQCKIILKYNTNGASGLSLSVSYQPKQYSQFTLSPLLSCPVPSSSGGEQICDLSVAYASTGTQVSENLTFTLGNANSNAIPISGN